MLKTKEKRLYTQMLEEAGGIYFPREVSQYFRRTGSARAPRPLSSVILPEGTIVCLNNSKGVKENIVSDIKKFLDNSKWYRDMGLL